VSEIHAREGIELSVSTIAKAVRRVDAIFVAERTITGLPAEQRPAVRRHRIAPLVAKLETWMREQRARRYVR